MKDRKVDLSEFTKGVNPMTIKSLLESFWGYREREVNRTYTLEEVEQIIESSSIQAKQQLSRNFFSKDGIYRRIILYYATLLLYSGLLTPHPAYGKKLSTEHIKKRYFKAMDYITRLNLPKKLPEFAMKALVNGCYYGVIKDATRKEFNLIDLPLNFCRSRFKHPNGTDMVEFNVNYFDGITDENVKEQVLLAYPEVITNYYRQYHDGHISSYWMIIPPEISVCFPFFDNCSPLFLDIIPAVMDYETTAGVQKERDLEEIRKIIVQKIPHLTDGQLLFEPDEALEMHKGTVSMMSNNKNVSVLTTYGDVDAIVSNTSADTANNSLSISAQHMYTDAGVSSQIFAADGSQAIPISIKNDKALMMLLANKFADFVTNVINNLFGNSNVTFSYTILPVSYYDQTDYITDALKLAQAGYSFLIPGIALGINQQQLIDTKELEIDVLKLNEKLVPLMSSFTQSKEDQKEGAGAPKKPLEQKKDKTIQNENAIDNQGKSS